MLSMAFHKALPERFGRTHPVYLTPTFATLSFGAVSVAYYVILNFVAHGNVIADAVTATTFFAALYLGITGVACAWHYRSTVRAGAVIAFSRFVVPAICAFSLFAVIVWSFKTYLDPSQSYFEVNLPIVGEVGGVILISVGATIVGLVWMFSLERRLPEYFSGESMASGRSLTDDDEVVEVSYD